MATDGGTGSRSLTGFIRFIPLILETLKVDAWLQLRSGLVYRHKLACCSRDCWMVRNVTASASGCLNSEVSVSSV